MEKMMQYQVFGKTGMKVSDIGFGAWAIGGSGWGEGCSDADSMAALERAFELGINLYDTCDSYGNGHSEKLIGEFMKGHRISSLFIQVALDFIIVGSESSNFQSYELND